MDVQSDRAVPTQAVDASVSEPGGPLPVGVDLRKRLERTEEE